MARNNFDGIFFKIPQSSLTTTSHGFQLSPVPVKSREPESEMNIFGGDTDLILLNHKQLV